LLALLREKSAGNLSTPVFVRADRDVSYGDVVRLFDEVRSAGYKNVSVVTEDPGG
jgi:biopolymer transport protein ExbD